MMIGATEKNYLDYTQYYAESENLKKERRNIQAAIAQASLQLIPEESRQSTVCELINELFIVFKGMFINNDNEVFTKSQTELKNKVDFLSNQSLEISIKINSITQKLTDLSIKTLNSEEAEKLIIEALGGAEKYHALPNINLGTRMGWDNKIDFILPLDLTDAIHQFQDKETRKGIAICAQSITSGKPIVQVFYQESKNSANWISRGSQIISMQGYLIQNGVLDINAYNQLKLLVNDQLPGWKQVSPKLKEQGVDLKGQSAVLEN